MDVFVCGTAKINFHWETIVTFHSKQYTNKNQPFCTNFPEDFLTGLNSFWLFISENNYPLYKKENIVILLPVNFSFKYVIRMELDSTKENCAVPIFKMQIDKD